VSLEERPWTKGKIGSKNDEEPDSVVKLVKCTLIYTIFEIIDL
jgi:hypothetical protein